MTTLIVNASSKSKRDDCDIPFKYASKPFHERMSKKHASEFLKARRKVMNEFKLDEGPDLLKGMADPSDGEYLPAYQRYAGRTYSKISQEAWDSLVASDGEYDMVILSALYGFIRYNEPMRNYEIKQVTDMKDMKVGVFWRKSGAKDWLLEYVKENKIDKVIFVLSVSYSKIIEKDKLIEELKNIGVETVVPKIEAKGMASMLERGKFINNFLTTIKH